MNDECIYHSQMCVHVCGKQAAAAEAKEAERLALESFKREETRRREEEQRLATEAEEKRKLEEAAAAAESTRKAAHLSKVWKPPPHITSRALNPKP